MHFAKLYSVSNNQILFTKDYQTERIGDKTYGIAYRIDINTEDKIEGRFGFDIEETMLKQWEKIDGYIAENILTSSLKFYEKN